MIKIDVGVEDNPEFVRGVNRVVCNIATQFAPDSIIVIKIDNWFGPKWLRFSGKALGAFGIWHEDLTVPPFVPNRVVWEKRFSPAKDAEIERGPSLHVAATASEASRRKVSVAAPGAALVWFSGKANTTERGAMMSYVPTPDDYWPWYAGWQKDVSWNRATFNGISESEFASLSGSPLRRS